MLTGLMYSRFAEGKNLECLCHVRLHFYARTMDLFNARLNVAKAGFEEGMQCYY